MAASSPAGAVHTRRDADVLVVTIDHPPVNALSAAVRADLAFQKTHFVQAHAVFGRHGTADRAHAGVDRFFHRVHGLGRVPGLDDEVQVAVGHVAEHQQVAAWVHRLRVPQGSYEVVVQYRSAPPSARWPSACSAKTPR